MLKGHDCLERHLVSTFYSSFCECNSDSDSHSDGNNDSNCKFHCKFHLLGVSDREKWTCEHGHVLQKRSICSGTWLANANLTLAESLKLTYMWAHQHTQQEAQHEARVGNNATVRWYHEQWEAWLLSKDDNIGGKGQIVEIGKLKFGKQKYHCGHSVDRSWVSFKIELCDVWTWIHVHGYAHI